MPNNTFGNSDPTISIPSRTPIANDPGFDILRQLDGRIALDEDGDMDGCERTNVHQVHGGAKYAD